MNQLERQGRQWTWPHVAIALLGGIVVLVLHFPASGIDTQPPECSSVFGYTVPCEAGWSVAAGVAAAAVIGMMIWMANGRKNKG